MITNLLLIAVIVVNIVDLSGIIDELEKILGKWLGIKAHIGKPFSCSYCMIHWCGLFYLLFSHQLTLTSYAVLLVICFLTTEINDICILLKQSIQRILATLFDVMTKR